jgi:isopentenyldiphosphate isomerase
VNRERSIVVDENDNEIGIKYRDELEPADAVRISSIWLENGKGQVLLAQRSLTKASHPGLWGPAAAGGVAEGETYEVNAYKELSEEIGVTDIMLEQVAKRKIVYSDHRGTRTRFCMWYRGVLDQPIEKFVLNEEVAQIKWVDKTWALEDVVKHPEHYTPSSHDWPTLFAG